MSYQNKAEEFLKVAKHFKLGDLPTEKPNPKTKHLSKWAKEDLSKALNVILEIEQNVANTLLQKKIDIAKLSKAIEVCFRAGGKIVLCGCGATGRLSLAIETIWRNDHFGKKEEDFVESFMAGGDVALIHSIENFEDYPEYGVRQLQDMNFGENDLLISCTEGGETPFVIGATEEATKISKFKPYFLYCNPDEILCEVAKRSQNVINNSDIVKINLSVGPMVLAGSTRMQASTILMAAVGFALNNFQNSKENLFKDLNLFKQLVSELEFEDLSSFIVKEADIYDKGKFLLYECREDLGISILTDTTERAPTFSLNSFENVNENREESSLSYLWFSHIHEGKEAWESLLKRLPRPLEWAETKELTGAERLKGFDFSSHVKSYRDSRLKLKQEIFKVESSKEGLIFELCDLKHTFKFDSDNLLMKHLLLKILLNTHSTLVMGRLNRYEDNIMTWVRPSNNKLIDRAVRYTDYLLRQSKIEKTYEELVFEIFKQMENIGRDDSIVLKMMESLKKD